MKSSLTIDDDRYWRFQEVMAKRRLGYKDAVEQAMDLWMGADPQVQALLALKASTDAQGKARILPLLDSWAERHKTKPGAEHGREQEETPDASRSDKRKVR